jgi:hypothetical protein
VLLGTVLNGASVQVRPPTGDLHEAFGPCGVVVRSTVRYAAPDKEATFLSPTRRSGESVLLVSIGQSIVNI